MRPFGAEAGTQALQILPPVPAFYWYLPRALWQKKKQWFTYTATFVGTTVLTASVATTVTTPINSDSHFIILGAMFAGYQTNDSTPLTAFPVSVQITDTTSGLQFQDAPVDILNCMGTQQLNQGTFWWEHPRFIRGGSTLQTILTNREAVNRNYRISYRGYKIYGQNIDDDTNF